VISLTLDEHQFLILILQCFEFVEFLPQAHGLPTQLLLQPLGPALQHLWQGLKLLPVRHNLPPGQLPLLLLLVNPPGNLLLLKLEFRTGRTPHCFLGQPLILLFLSVVLAAGELPLVDDEVAAGTHDRVEGLFLLGEEEVAVDRALVLGELLERGQGLLRGRRLLAGQEAEQG
jgi:hypothetical protein